MVTKESRNTGLFEPVRISDYKGLEGQNRRQNEPLFAGNPKLAHRAGVLKAVRDFYEEKGRQKCRKGQVKDKPTEKRAFLG